MPACPEPLQAAFQHLQAGRLKAGADLAGRSLAADPAQAEALYLLGTAMGMAGAHGSAIRWLERLLALRPGMGGIDAALTVATINHAATLAAAGDLRGAISACRRASGLAPDLALAPANLGWLMIASGDRASACRAFRRAASLDPASFLQLAQALSEAEGGREPMPLYQRLLRLMPDDAGLLANLCGLESRQGQTDRALALGRRAVTLSPSSSAGLCSLGNALTEAGYLDQGIRAYRRALTVAPGSSSVSSNLLLALQYQDTPPEALFMEHRRYDIRHGRPRWDRIRQHANSPDPYRRLRIGYLSNDFRQHVASFFFAPLLSSHDPLQVETVCYSDTLNPDAVTAHLKARADRWRDCMDLDEDALDAQIRADGIDVLIDLNGHTAGNRLTLFGRRPAPVQVTWLGYPDTTGMTTMDYRLVDTLTDPPGEADILATETLLRLHGFLCFRPPDDAPEPGELPAKTRGHVTFGSFNRLSKVSERTIALWSEVLRRVPGSHLLMKARPLADISIRTRLRAAFAAHGIDAERLALVAWTASPQRHLELYQSVDIALDTFPYHGTTTTCEALWMGVPVISLRGNRHAARVGASLLTRAGLDELVTATPDDFVATAVSLAGDVERLAALRSGMRAHLSASSLTDAPAFARSVEAAYRRIWHEWCVRRR